MARKVCPACKKLNAGSATTCSCGHAFEASSVVAASRPKMKRCPRCNSELARLLETCACGHVFEDVRELREQIEDRVRVGWSLVVLGLLALGGCVGLMIVTSGKFIIGLVAGTMLIARGVMMRGDARSQLEDIRGAAGTLPAAKVVR